jgi:transmembrane 9 superfamily member 2/4
MTFDSLPVLMRSEDLNYAVRGSPVGFMASSAYSGFQGDTYYLYNHLKLTITYRTLDEGGYHITGFDVHPVSIAHDDKSCEAGADALENNPKTYLELREQGTTLPVTYSYEVEWSETDLLWSDRWDVYLVNSPDDDIHFFAIVNSLMIVMFLTGAIATIMIKTLKRDIAAYNEVSMLDDEADETGWKLVHGDVFRPPQNRPMFLAVAVGTGAQIGTAFFATMLTSIVGLVNPIKKGQTLTAILVLYVMSGSVSGYISARIAKFSGCKSIVLTAILTATTLPGFLVGMFTVLNIFLSMAGAATAVPSWLLLSIFALWVCVSAPLVFIGAFFGGKATKIEVPVKTNQIARVVPEQHWYTTPPVSYLLGGILPFGSVCIELFFIMSAVSTFVAKGCSWMELTHRIVLSPQLWLHQIYYVMGFLLAVLLILAATCAQVSIVMVYLQLCAEDHRWWWKSFFNCASAGLYLFLYSLWFLVSRLDLVGLLPVVIYLTYMGMISLCFGLFCGSVGFICSFAFNRTIYGALKVD